MNAHAALGKLYMGKAGNMAEAVPEIERTLQLAPKDHIALNQLILAYRKLGPQSGTRNKPRNSYEPYLPTRQKRKWLGTVLRLRVAKP